MESNYCQPCKSQSNDKNATVWCRDCEQLLCEGCHNYHKVLKITKDHVIIKTEDYFDIADFLKLLNTKCEFHPETEMKYHCPVHKTIICILCKIDKHKDCTNIQLMDKIVSTKEIYRKIQTFSEKVCDRISILDIISNDRIGNIERLDNQRMEFIKNLKDNRDKINLALDKLELELKAKFEVGYQFEKKRTEGELDTYNKTKVHWQKEYDQLVKINQHKPMSNVQLYLAEQHLKKYNDEEELKVKNFVANISEASFECCLSLEISKSNRSITINDKIKVTSFKPKFDPGVIIENKFDHKSQETDNNITDSSTIEEENIIHKEKIEQFKESDLQSYKNDDDQRQTLKQVEKTETSEDKETIVLKTYQFIYSKHFTISKKMLNITIRCVKHLPNGNLIFGEVGQPRLLVYDKLGDLKGKINMKCSPRSIAVIDNERVAVTTGKAVMIVNFDTFHIDKTFGQGDNCYGVTFINGTLLVNCKTTGLKVLDLSGVLQKTFNSLKGVLYMTGINPETLIYVESGSQLVNFFNITTTASIFFKCSNLRKVTGITIDDKTNLYVSCGESDKIYMLRCGSERWNGILTTKDNIYQPECIDFYKDALYVINDKRVVCTYRLKQ